MIPLAPQLLDECDPRCPDCGAVDHFIAFPSGQGYEFFCCACAYEDRLRKIEGKWRFVVAGTELGRAA